MTIICNRDRFRVNKALVCGQSAVLQKKVSANPFVSDMMHSGKKKGWDADSQDALKPGDDEYELVLKLNPVLVERMIQYFYDGKYKASCDGPATSLRLHAQMFALADKLEVPGLFKLAAENYAALAAGVSVGDLLGSVRDIYRLTPPHVRWLRDYVVGVTRDKANRAAGAGLLMQQYQTLVDREPEFMKDLFSAYVYACVVAQFKNYPRRQASFQPQLSVSGDSSSAADNKSSATTAQ